MKAARRRRTRGQRHAAAAARRTGWCVCGKVEYVTIAAARRAKNDIGRVDDKVRIYPCPNKARTWHLTSMGRERDDAE